MEKIDYYCHNNILKMLEINDQVNYLSTCSIFYNKLTIETVSSVNPRQNNISNHIFRNVTTLDASNNYNISNVSFMKKLKILKANGL
jgi:hypothetical protein